MQKINFWALLCSFVLLAACDDILEEDITDSKVLLVSPGEGVHLQENKVTFLWEPVGGASGYLLQLVKPSFEEPVAVLLDTFLTRNRFEHTLPAGAYAWRISAENSAYYSPYAAGSFVIDSVGSTSIQGINLFSPANNLVTQEAGIKFSWNKAEGTDRYKLKFSGASDFEAYLNDTTITLQINAFDDTLKWQVFGLGTDQQLKYHSPMRWLIVDRAPAAVKLEAPALNSSFTASQPINFSWQASTLPDLKHYLLSIYDGVTNEPIGQFQPMELNETEKTLFGGDSPLPVGTYLWEIKTVDKLGNMSTVGVERRAFEVKE